MCLVTCICICTLSYVFISVHGRIITAWHCAYTLWLIFVMLPSLALNEHIYVCVWHIIDKERTRGSDFTGRHHESAKHTDKIPTYYMRHTHARVRPPNSFWFNLGALAARVARPYHVNLTRDAQCFERAGKSPGRHTVHEERVVVRAR